MTTMHNTIRMLRRGTSATSRHLCPLRCESPHPDCRCLGARLAVSDPANTPAPPPHGRAAAIGPRRHLDGDLTGVAPAPCPASRPAPTPKHRLDIALAVITTLGVAGLALALALAIYGV